MSFFEVKNTLSTKILKGIITFLMLNTVAFVLLLTFYFFIDSPNLLIHSIKTKRYSEKYTSLTDKVDSLAASLKTNHYINDQIYRYILELDSLPANVRSAGTGGHNPYGSSMISFSSQFFNTLMRKIETLKRQVSVQDESYEEILQAALQRSIMLDHFPGIPPVKPSDYVWISSYFGTRDDPFLFFKKAHLGVDFCGPKNTDIYATAKGTVTLIKQSRKGYGNEILVDHGFGHITRYAHLNSILVEEGQQVERGQIIGLMGNTGRSTGTHLHYEVWYQQQPVNPLHFFTDDLTPEEFEQLAKNN